MGYALSKHHADLLEEYLAFEKPRTGKGLYNSLASFIRRALCWFDDEDLNVLTIDITEAIRCAAWIAEYQTKAGQTVSTGTVLNFLKAIRRFFDFLVQTERIKTNPFQEVRNPRKPEHLSRNVLTEAQMGRLLAELARFDHLPRLVECYRRYRVHVLAEFLYATGLRIDEAVSLTIENFDLPHRLVYLPHGKGGKPRMAFLTGYAVQVLEGYINGGRAAIFRPQNATSKLFGKNSRILCLIANRELKALCIQLGLPVVTTHCFRHSIGTHLLRSGCDMRYIQVILGHESLATTQIYTRVDKDDLKRSLDEFHPRKWNQRGGRENDT